jgi:hypothetical protein
MKLRTAIPRSRFAIALLLGCDNQCFFQFGKGIDNMKALHNSRINYVLRQGVKTETLRLFV